MMGRKALLLMILGILGAYYVYTPLPDNIEEPWSLMLVDTVSRTVIKLISFVDFLGLGYFLDIGELFKGFHEVPPTSDENVTVMDTTFSSIPVRVYLPNQKSETLRRGVFYIHGGGWSFGSAALLYYDLLSRQTAEILDAVVVSTNYRLAPKHHFPTQFEDVHDALRWFMRHDVLATYGVDPERVTIAGDSAGGNLAAAVTQQLMEDPDAKIKPKAQVLIYPALQALDMDSPSYRENSHFPILSRSLMVWFWSTYFTTDKALQKAMLLNQHVPRESSHLFKFVNWSSLLPERFKKGHVYKGPTPGSSELAKKYPGMLDVRASPLLANDHTLRRLPRTYVITCQYDVLRDDGVMYVTRLRNAGVPVTHEHIEDGFHGTFSFLQMNISHRMIKQYVSWLEENL